MIVWRSSLLISQNTLRALRSPSLSPSISNSFRQLIQFYPSPNPIDSQRISTLASSTLPNNRLRAVTHTSKWSEGLSENSSVDQNQTFGLVPSLADHWPISFNLRPGFTNRLSTLISQSKLSDRLLNQSKTTFLSRAVEFFNRSKSNGQNDQNGYRRRFVMNFSNLILCESMILNMDEQAETQGINLEQNQLERELEALNLGKRQSIVSLSKLSFGSLVGLFVGIFLRKGLSIAGFFLGGGFFILQYLHSKSLIDVNWPGFKNRYDSFISSLIGTRDDVGNHFVDDEGGDGGGVELRRIFKALIDFLTQDFQYRSTFILGFFLGFKMG
ncbi:expressed protein [Phakopsora pachyrhizi]|uniref:Expressed protein n=1 Tax=Phakopsora pachyrhizi TaxID=170000 RepID=A0AAV0AN74_PHAPC|nr:expressed protein [Phakopsora pachyrhizi]